MVMMMIVVVVVVDDDDDDDYDDDVGGGNGTQSVMNEAERAVAVVCSCRARCWVARSTRL